MTPLLAHQGGWDEILLILGPIAVIAGLLRLAKRRADRIAPLLPPDHPSSGAAGGTDRTAH